MDDISPLLFKTDGQSAVIVMSNGLDDVPLISHFVSHYTIQRSFVIVLYHHCSYTRLHAVLRDAPGIRYVDADTRRKDAIKDPGFYMLHDTVFSADLLDGGMDLSSIDGVLYLLPDCSAADTLIAAWRPKLAAASVWVKAVTTTPLLFSDVHAVEKIYPRTNHICSYGFKRMYIVPRTSKLVAKAYEQHQPRTLSVVPYVPAISRALLVLWNEVRYISSAVPLTSNVYEILPSIRQADLSCYVGLLQSNTLINTLLVAIFRLETAVTDASVDGIVEYLGHAFSKTSYPKPRTGSLIQQKTLKSFFVELDEHLKKPGFKNNLLSSLKEDVLEACQLITTKAEHSDCRSGSASACEVILFCADYSMASTLAKLFCRSEVYYITGSSQRDVPQPPSKSGHPAIADSVSDGETLSVSSDHTNGYAEMAILRTIQENEVIFACALSTPFNSLARDLPNFRFTFGPAIRIIPTLNHLTFLPTKLLNSLCGAETLYDTATAGHLDLIGAVFLLGCSLAAVRITERITSARKGALQVQMYKEHELSIVVSYPRLLSRLEHKCLKILDIASLLMDSSTQQKPASETTNVGNEFSSSLPVSHKRDSDFSCSISIDKREIKSAIPVDILCSGVPVETIVLPIGDYIIRILQGEKSYENGIHDIPIERKAEMDLVSSLNGQRLFKQVANMAAAYDRVLVICSVPQGRSHKCFADDELNLVRQKSLATRYISYSSRLVALLALHAKQCSILWTTPGNFAAMICAIARHRVSLLDTPRKNTEETHAEVRGDPEARQKANNILRVLRKLPGLSGRDRDLLLMQFTCLRDIILASKESLYEALGDMQKADTLHRFFTGPLVAPEVHAAAK